jgi:hypothetical protein
MNRNFTAQEANEKIGKVIRTLREFSGVPIGTSGTVTGKYPRGYPPGYMASISHGTFHTGGSHW